MKNLRFLLSSSSRHSCGDDADADAPTAVLFSTPSFNIRLSSVSKCDKLGTSFPANSKAETVRRRTGSTT